MFESISANSSDNISILLGIGIITMTNVHEQFLVRRLSFCFPPSAEFYFKISDAIFDKRKPIKVMRR